MSYLRFSPAEYRVVSELSGTLNINRCRPAALKRFLAEALADALPELAGPIASFRRQEAHILHEHLRRQRQSRERHDLTTGELALLAEAFGPQLRQVRFLRPLKSALVDQFRAAFPDLAAKLDRLSPVRFESLCEQIKEWARKSP